MGPRKPRAVAVLIGLVLLAGLVTPAAAAPARQVSSGVIAAQAALSKRGYPYVWGGKGPSSFDCSGLTFWAYQQAGYNIGRSTYDQAHAGTAISCGLSDLHGPATTCWQPGDLIFLRYTGGQHVAMYIGNGLFADAYNSAVGVIVHDPAADSYYWAHYWQSRRISTGTGTVDAPVAPPDGAPGSIPGLEEIPDIVGQVSFAVPQCGSCNPDGSTLLAPVPWGESWPVGFEALDLPRVFRTVISWLSWRIGEFIRQLICWLLAMLAMLAGFLAGFANIAVYGINSLFKLLLLLWLSLKAYFFALWDILESMRALLAGVIAGLAGLAELGRLTLEIAALIGSLLMRLLALFGQIALMLIGLVGWMGGLVLGFFAELQTAISGTNVPVQISGTHQIYYATRGTLEGVRDSGIGWAITALWAMAYVVFIAWLAAFLPGGE